MLTEKSFNGLQKERNRQNKGHADFQKERLKAQNLNGRWRALCEKFLTVVPEKGIWRFHRLPARDDLSQGWKLHVSATVLTACDAFEKIAPFLSARNAQFKAPSSLDELYKINRGLDSAYSQVGKFVTVYPQSSEEAVEFAARLDELTRGFAAPTVPFDLQYRAESCVFYRYGAFEHLEAEGKNGKTVAVIHDAAGNFVPDTRENAHPDWVSNPFPVFHDGENLPESVDNPFITRFKVFRALRQRGKGGVYQAIDLSTEKPRLCIIKEGRRNGETDFTGRDGFWRVRREADVLAALTLTNINAPRIFSTFEFDRNFYLAIEFIEGKSLHELLKKRRRRFSVRRVLQFGLQTAKLLAQIHDAGWIWGDCKPGNLIVTANKELRPIDFESSSLIGEPEVSSWQTPEFSLPADFQSQTPNFAEKRDLYALGAVIYFLLTGKIYEPETPSPVKKLRRGVPLKLQKLIEGLLVATSPKDLTAGSAAEKFRKILNDLTSAKKLKN